MNKLPGDTCINNYECKSNRCEIPKGDSGEPLEGVGPHCQGQELEEACSSDHDCTIGLYCDEETKNCED